jgi:hypothetical protein
MRKTSMFAVALALASASVMLPRGVRAQASTQAISETRMAGAFSVTLKVLPAESFAGADAEMTRDGGAPANMVKGPEHPDHHMVAFLTHDGKPVESATVAIRYRRTSPNPTKWMRLPVARMHVAGKGLETTHFGNNVKLSPGDYSVRVSVNRSKPALFHITIPTSK